MISYQDQTDVLDNSADEQSPQKSSLAGQSARTGIVLSNVTKWFYSNGTRSLAINGVNLNIRDGSFVSLVGPSGCGKSTILNCIAGLLPFEDGEILCDGKKVSNINVGIGYMTQKDYLLPSRNVLDNVILPLQAAGVKKEEARSRALDFIRRVGLAGAEARMPKELSGGMLKRAAMARTLVYNPRTILMDEPFGNVDAQLKLQLQRELLGIWEREQQTVVFVTHDLEEAIALSDQIIVLTGQPGSIKEIVDINLPRPRDPISIRFDAKFQELHQYLWSLIDVTIGGD